MKKLKMAMLEDNVELLRALKKDFEKTGLVDIVAYSTNSSDFIRKVEAEKPDAIAVDIELPGDSMNGMDVANRLMLPTLFVSGNTREYIERYVELNSNPEIIVEILSKTVSSAKLQGILPKFFERVLAKQKRRKVTLKISGEGSVVVDANDIVYLTTVGESSGNCVVYFSNRKPAILIDFPVKNAEAWETEIEFLKISGSERVNRNKVVTNRATEVEVFNIDKAGREVKTALRISEGFQPAIRKVFRN